MFLPTMLDSSECRDSDSGFIFVQLVIYDQSTESSVVNVPPWEIARVNKARPNEETIQCTYISFLCFPNIAGSKVLRDIKVCPIEKSVDLWISGPRKLVDRRNIHQFCLPQGGSHGPGRVLDWSKYRSWMGYLKEEEAARTHWLWRG